ncbi:MAG: hypothetical protein A2W22_04620 [Candidatus Levybacteria bacterium RBG_16_35_11]|nr:MAG: hypothetical protein A2W22_04620 [Candidatus Levybacteria bacterium RBG_16_35_11]
MKMLTLDILDKSAKRLTRDEILDELNRMPFIGKVVKAESLKENLRRYKQLGLITGRKRRVVKHYRGRQKLELKLTLKGKKALKRYWKNWSMGLLVPIKFKGKTKKMTQDFKARASGIRGKIGKVYDTFDFILPERRKL